MYICKTTRESELGPKIKQTSKKLKVSSQLSYYGGVGWVTSQLKSQPFVSSLVLGSQLIQSQYSMMDNFITFLCCDWLSCVAEHARDKTKWS